MPKLKNYLTGEVRELGYDFEGTKKAMELRMSGQWVDVLDFSDPLADLSKGTTGLK